MQNISFQPHQERFSFRENPYRSTETGFQVTPNMTQVAIEESPTAIAELLKRGSISITAIQNEKGYVFKIGDKVKTRPQADWNTGWQALLGILGRLAEVEEIEVQEAATRLLRSRYGDIFRLDDTEDQIH